MKVNFVVDECMYVHRMGKIVFWRESRWKRVLSFSREGFWFVRVSNYRT